LKSFFIDIFRRNRYLLLAATILFLSGYFLNIYYNSDASVSVLRNSIQSYMQERERDFGRLTGDSALLHRLYSMRTTEQELARVVEKKYGIFLYETDTADRPGPLKFWNDQRILPPPGLLNGPDGNRFIQLSNGQYDCIRKTLADSNGLPIIAIALIPVRWQYFIPTSNLTPEFTDRPAAEERLELAAAPTEFPVKNSDGNILFYLQKSRAIMPRPIIL